MTNKVETPVRITDHVKGFDVFERRTKNILLPVEQTPGVITPEGVRTWWMGPPRFSKTTGAQENNAKWLQVIKESYMVAMEDCLREVRHRAGVLGKDYTIQSQHYILAATSHLMAYTGGIWIPHNLTPPWHVDLQATVVPYPLRDYAFTSLKTVVQRALRTGQIYDEFVSFMPDEKLYQKTFADREELEKIDLTKVGPAERERIIRLKQSMAPIEVINLLSDMTFEVINKLVATKELHGVQPNYRNSFETTIQAIRRLMVWYGTALLAGQGVIEAHEDAAMKEYLNELIKQRIFIRTNEFREGKITPPPDKTFNQQHGLPMPDIATECFRSKDGLGEFKPEGGLIGVEPPGLRWISIRSSGQYGVLNPGEEEFLRIFPIKPGSITPDLAPLVLETGQRIITQILSRGEEAELDLKELTSERVDEDLLPQILEEFAKAKLIRRRGKHKIVLISLDRLREALDQGETN